MSKITYFLYYWTYISITEDEWYSLTHIVLMMWIWKENDIYKACKEQCNTEKYEKEEVRNTEIYLVATRSIFSDLYKDTWNKQHKQSSNKAVLFSCVLIYSSCCPRSLDCYVFLKSFLLEYVASKSPFSIFKNCLWKDKKIYFLFVKSFIRPSELEKWLFRKLNPFL